MLDVLTSFAVLIVLSIIKIIQFVEGGNMYHQEKVYFLNCIKSRLIERYHFPKDIALFVACQFALESKFGHSTLALVFSNYCGMKQPVKRITTSDSSMLVESSEFAYYHSLDDCVLDYVLWLQYNKVDLHKGLDSFSKSIRSYCPESDYLNKIFVIYNQFKS